MASRGDLEAAAAAGVIAPDQVGPLSDFLAARTAPAPGEEELRFIRNFHDVFLAIGIVILGVGLAVAIGALTEHAENGRFYAIATYCLASAGVMWILGELFARRRRLFLPALAICGGFAAFIGFGAYYALRAAAGLEHVYLWDDAYLPHAARLAGQSLAFAAVAAGAFYLRFRLPFSLGLTGALAATAALMGLADALPDAGPAVAAALQFGLGAVLFAAGLGFDARDPARATRFSDNGFWLHVAAAPFVLNGAVGLAVAPFKDIDAEAYRFAPWDVRLESDPVQAGAALAVIAVLGLISLLINRRALVVSALVTVGVAIWSLLNETDLGAGALGASTLITLGAFVLVLGAGWHGARRVLVGWVQPGSWFSRVFPPEAPPAAA